MAIENRCGYCGVQLPDNTAAPHQCQQPMRRLSGCLTEIPLVMATGHPCGTGCQHVAYENEIARLRAQLSAPEANAVTVDAREIAYQAGVRFMVQNIDYAVHSAASMKRLTDSIVAALTPTNTGGGT